MIRVLAISRVGQHVAFAFLPNGMVFAETTIVFPFSTHATFCTLKSRSHEIWGTVLQHQLMEGSTSTIRLQTASRLSPSPKAGRPTPSLEATGKAYYEHRAALMVRNAEGMTKTYNRFHDPYENDPDIDRLRELHAAMDRAVLDAYDWTDIPTDCDFLLDYEIDEEPLGAPEEEALPLPLAGRRPRRGACPPPRPQRRTRRLRKPVPVPHPGRTTGSARSVPPARRMLSVCRVDDGAPGDDDGHRACDEGSDLHLL